MPSAPAFTIAEAAYQTAAPIDTYVLRSNGQPASILDTIFVSRKLRRAVYATTTSKGKQTDLWRVEQDGKLGNVACILWEYEWQSSITGCHSAGDGSLKKGSGPVKRIPAVCFMGRIWRVDEFLRKGRGWFPSDSRLFTVGDVEFKWKSGTENSSTSDGQHGRSSTRAYHELWKIWRCIVANPSTSSPSPAQPTSSSSEMNSDTSLQSRDPISTVPSPLNPSLSNSVPTPHTLRHMPSIDSFTVAQDLLSPSASNARALLTPLLAAPAPPTILARFAPPQLGLDHHELALFPPVFSSAHQDQNQLLLENLLLSAVLLAVNKGEWKNVQSLTGREGLEAIFVAEVKGELPPYTTTQVGHVVRPPTMATHQRDRIGMQQSRNPSPEEIDVVRPRTAPARQRGELQNVSQVDRDSRSGHDSVRQLHRIAHSIADGSEWSSAAQLQSPIFAYSLPPRPPPSTPMRSVPPPVSFRMSTRERPSTSDSNRSGRTIKAGDGIFSGRRPSRSRSRPSTSVGPNEERVCGSGPSERRPDTEDGMTQLHVAGIETGGQNGLMQGGNADMVELEEKSSSPFPPPAYFRSFLD